MRTTCIKPLLAQLCLKLLLLHRMCLCSWLGTQNRLRIIFLPHLDHAHTCKKELMKWVGQAANRVSTQYEFQLIINILALRRNVKVKCIANSSRVLSSSGEDIRRCHSQRPCGFNLKFHLIMEHVEKLALVRHDSESNGFDTCRTRVSI